MRRVNGRGAEKCLWVEALAGLLAHAGKDCARPKVEEEGDVDWGGGAWGERRGTTGVA